MLLSAVWCMNQYLRCLSMADLLRRGAWHLLVSRCQAPLVDWAEARGWSGDFVSEHRAV